ncbi:MAG: hypothetical protein JRM80_13900 [Nitrososphaerota archaeon]|nr:hypothetical protein [Nitrososphaerota archaeon]
MPDANLLVLGTLAVLAALLLVPYGGAALKLFLILVASAVLAFSLVRAARRRSANVKKK